MNIDPRHLTAVLAIVKHGTFSRAADALGMGQPALSKSVSQLERRLGVKLFERSARGSSLTAAGRIVARRAEGLDMLLSRLREEIGADAEHLDGPIEIGATPSLMLGLVPDALVRTLADNPRLTANITEGLDDALTPALQRGAIDLLVCPLDGQDLLPPDIVEHEVSSEALFAVLPRGHRLAGAAVLSIAQLRDEAWILPRSGGSFHRLIEALFIAAGVPWPRNAIGTDRLHVHARLVAEANRVAIVSATHLVDAPAARLEAIPLAGAPRRRLGVRRRSGVRLAPAAESFIAHLGAAAADLSARWSGDVGR